MTGIVTGNWSVADWEQRTRRCFGGRRRRTRPHSGDAVETLEVRTLLTTAPVLAVLSDVTLLAGSPLHVPLNASDAEGQSLTFSVGTSNANVSTLIPEGNRSLRVNVVGFGSMVFELFEKRVPRVTSQLITLADAGYYANSGFHFVSDGERIQGGKPGGDPFDETPSPLGAVDDEFHVELQHNQTGLLSLARDGLDDTGDAQFLITEGTQRSFDAQHSVAGLLVEGESVREAISSVSANGSGRPDTPVMISSVDVFEDDQNGVLMLQAPEGYSGSVMITVIVTDTDGNEDQQTFTVDVVPDTVNTPPWLADLPPVQTLTDTAVALPLNAVDVEGDAASFFDEMRLDMFGLFVPHRSAVDLTYGVDPLTGLTQITPTNGVSGTQLITVATAIQPTAIDYQVLPVQIISAAVPLSFAAGDGFGSGDADDGIPDTFRLVRADDSLHLFINAELAYVAALDSVATLTIDGSSDEDTLILDVNGGDPVPSGGLFFNGGPSVTDTLFLTGDGDVSVERDVAADALSINGKLVTVTGTEALTDEATVSRRVFSFGADDDVIVFEDNDAPGDGVSRLSNATTGFSFDFATPASLTVSSGDGADSILIAAADGPSPDAILLGGAGDDSLTGGEGNDSLDGDRGRDVLFGRGGDDVLVGKADRDTLFGGDGNDQLSGSAGKDDLSGDAGDDTLLGQGATGDTLRGGDGNDLLDGGAGNDIVIEVVSGDVTLTTSSLDGRGFDILAAIERINLSGSAGNDRIDASQFDVPGFTAVTLYGGGGDDLLIGSNGNDQLSGNGGNDTLESGAGRDRLYGGSGQDRLSGGDGDDKLLGNGGSGDWLSGGEGDDTMKGGAGSDRLVEAADVNFVLTNTRLSGLGNDRLSQLEAASLAGGPGDNILDASAFTNGFVLLFGLGGDDSLLGGSGHDRLEGGSGNDTLRGGDGVDRLRGGDGNDGLAGNDGADSLEGQEGDDSLFGGDHADNLNGGSGSDLLVGEADDDQLNGDEDGDTLVGGAGDGMRETGDQFDDVSEVIDDYFLTHPLPDWMD